MDDKKPNTALIKVNTGIARIEKLMGIKDKLLAKIDTKIVTIGTQVWTIENLNVSTFCNGDMIPEAQSDEEWQKASDERKPAWCYYNRDVANGNKYGKLYNWYAIHDSRGLAPQGWHIPSENEWDTLANYLGGDKVAGHKMKSAEGWKNEGNGNNSSGFRGIPAGFRSYNCTFYSIGQFESFWSSIDYISNGAWSRNLDYNDSSLDHHGDYKGCGFSVRCVRD